MNPLTILNHNGVEVVDSREVAAMIDKRHDHLIRDIHGYVEIMENSGAPNFGDSSMEGLGKLKIEPSDFFIPSTYISEQNKELPCYLLTKKGCDMVANKLTGEKGVLFTAAYVTAFERMHEQLAISSVPISEVSLGSVASMIRIMRCIMLDVGRTTPACDAL